MRNTKISSIAMAGLLIAVFMDTNGPSGRIQAQDLPPGVLLLAQVKRHMREELGKLPNVTCLETMQRDHQEPGGRMEHLDTIRLEVMTNGRKELYASAGERKFSEQHPMTFAGSGVTGEGLFGSYLRNILTAGAVSNSYHGDEQIAGHRLARFDYRLPQLAGGETIQTLYGVGMVGLRGSYWADPETRDITAAGRERL